MIELLESAFRYTVCGIIGYTLGTILAYRRAKLAGLSLLVPFVPKTSRNFTIIVSVLAFLTAFTVISGQLQASHARNCEQQFREALTTQARINGEDRMLETEDDELRDKRDDALDRMVSTIIASAQARDGSALRALEEYNKVAGEIKADQSALRDRRDGLQRDREANPYPSPLCD